MHRCSIPLFVIILPLKQNEKGKGNVFFLGSPNVTGKNGAKSSPDDWRTRPRDPSLNHSHETRGGKKQEK